MSEAERQQDPSRDPHSDPEAVRFEFTKDLEARKLELEERKLTQARFDTWSRFAATIMTGLIVTGAIQIYAIFSEKAAKERAEIAERGAKARAEVAQKVQVAIQLTNAREKALSDLRAQMFDALLQNYFKQANERERIAILELMALNFRDAVQIRPMLELMDAELSKTRADQDNASLRIELRRAARAIIRDQLDQIRQSKEGGVSRFNIKVGETARPDCFPLLAVNLLRVLDASRIEVRTNSKDGLLLGMEATGDSFGVTYFDMPMTDYTTVRSLGQSMWRYSIVLHDVARDRKSAELGVACLPVSPVGAERRYAFDELLEQFLNPAPNAEQGTWPAPCGSLEKPASSHTIALEDC